MGFVTRIWDVEEGLEPLVECIQGCNKGLTSRIESKLKELISRSQ